MKRMICGLLIGALAAGVALSKASAAEKDKDEKKPGIEKRVDKRLEKLGISEEQADKLKEAFKAHRKAAKPLHRELRDAMTKLKDRVEDEASDKDLQAAIDRVQAARKAIQADREKFEDSLSGLVPTAARAKMMLHIGARMGRGGAGFGPGKGFGAHPGFGPGMGPGFGPGMGPGFGPGMGQGFGPGQGRGVGPRKHGKRGMGFGQQGPAGGEEEEEDEGADEAED